MVSINKFCISNSNGIPFEELAPKFESFSFLTDVRYIKGYEDDGLWIEPEFEINSKLAPSEFGCNLLVDFKSETDDSIITIGHYKLEEFGYKFIKISLL